MANYIKMSRGKKAAYEKAKQAGSLNNNTLYFIYDDESEATGSLYLGTRLISGGDSQVISSALADLSDVSIDEGAADGDFIVRNDLGNWVSTHKDKVAETLVAIMKSNGDIAEHVPQVWTGSLTPEDEGDIQAAITRILAGGTAYVGDVVILDNSVLIYDGSQWSKDTYYSAGERVKFSKDITVDEKTTIEATGKTLDEVLKQVAQMGGAKGDGTSIEVGEDGKTFSIFNFAKNYYKKSDSDFILTPGFKAGLIPVVRAKDAGFELGWYEPGEIETIEQLSKSVQTLTTKIADVYTKSETDTAIAEALSNAPKLTYKVCNSVDEINKDAADATQYIYLVKKQDGEGYDQYIVPTKGTDPIKVGGFDVDLSAYALKTDVASDKEELEQSIEAAKTEASTKATELEGQIQSTKSQLEAKFNDYVTNTVYKAEVGNLNDIMGYEAGTSIVKEINKINKQLTWEELTE